MNGGEALSYQILTDVTTTVASEAISVGSNNKAFQVKGSTTSGAGAASVVIEVSNDPIWPWITLATISLTLGTTETSDGVVMLAGWKWVRIRVASISGTGAKVSASVGV